MKKVIFLFTLFVAATLNFAVAQQMFSWVHTTNSTNVSGTNNYTVLDHVSINNNPNAIVLANAEFAGVYKSVGVWYNGSRWTVFYQDQTPMGLNRKFHIAVVNSLGIIHTASATNTTKNWTEIDNPALNKQPNMIVTVTQRYNSAYNNHPIGVWYNATTKRWCIYNEDLVNMPINAQFNIYASSIQTPAVGNANGYPMVSSYTIQNGANVMPQSLGDANDVMILTHNFTSNLYYNCNFEVGRDVAALPNQWGIWGNPYPSNNMNFSVLCFAKP